MLDPVVYPHRDIPWTLIAIGTGLCLVLGLILFGGWQAYKAIDAVASASFEPIESATAATGAATGAATDVADQVAADATAAVQGAGKAIDRLASAVSNSIEVPKIEVPKILGDSHERLADERDQLQAEYARIRNEYTSGNLSEIEKKFLDLDLKIGDLAIRWYLLPPLSTSERDRLEPRLKVQAGMGLSGNPVGERDSAFAREPAALVAGPHRTAAFGRHRLGAGAAAAGRRLRGETRRSSRHQPQCLQAALRRAFGGRHRVE